MKNKKILSVFLMVIGVLALVFAIIIGSLYCGSYEYNETYGGDAYTGIQNAAAQASNNILETNRIITSVSRMAFILISAVLEAVGICGLLPEKKNKKNDIICESTPVDNPTNPSLVS